MTVSLTITISRTLLPGSLSPLVLSGVVDANAIGITRYSPPALQQRLTYAPDSADVHGSELIAAAYQQSILGFDFVTNTSSESTQQTSLATVVAALGQFTYTVTTQVSGATAQVWRADPGDIRLAAADGRTYSDLTYANPEYAVTIPVYPIAS